MQNIFIFTKKPMQEYIDKAIEIVSITWVRYSIIVVVTLGVALLLTRLIRVLLNRFFKSSSDKLKVDATKFSFIKNAASFLIFLAALIIIFYSIPELKALGLTLFAGAGIVAAILAFASQQAFSNIISGIFLVIFKPFRVGDNIKVGNLYHGLVEDITLRHTVIRDFENRRVIIPNSIISSESIVNASIADEKICAWVEMDISYDSDIDKAMSIMQQEAMKHPSFIDNRSPEEKKEGVPEVRVRLIGFGDSSVNLRAYVWAENALLAFAMKCDLYKEIKEEFDKAGIEIPFPHRTIVYKESKTKILPNTL
ncbi:MAG: mechanosensitive ion channel family protein [Bacteroidales bacterium]|nr:mechanosensitive ion channel family protein [Bacteroidales bacterium]MCF8345134.1 mechanosensitive ion channel family protein [Bacteroidales bacterium]MCF8351308.1 mechanosensitive ion channel family protein [Bacteroidales bacterium]MCF8376896.1 mechanosensitive ion channel family protein [Bacteroidales bacterium]MCF8400835.1 mechanosensitive ion channel family protein [Bacteroidales bacterium]